MVESQSRIGSTPTVKPKPGALDSWDGSLQPLPIRARPLD